jgi:hypothetical protein
LKFYTSGQNTIQVSSTDYKLVINELNKIDKNLARELKKEYRKIAATAQKSVKNELDSLGRAGPSRGMRHGGRTGWGTNYGSTGGPISGVKRYPFNSVLIEAFTRAKKGQTGIARLRVRSAATVLTDLAKNFRGVRKTRSYNIRLFGGPEITRKHTTSWTSVAYFIRNLGPTTKPSLKGKSRNVYPGFDKAYPEVRREVVLAIEKTVRIVKENIDRNSK